MNLKFEAPSRKCWVILTNLETGWEFSPDAGRPHRGIHDKIPRLLRRCEAKPVRKQNWSRQICGRTPPVASARVKEIGQWLKSLKTNDLERVPLDAEQLDFDGVMQLAQAADKFQLSSAPVKTTKMNGVPRNTLMRPQDAEHRLGNQKFSLATVSCMLPRLARCRCAVRGTVVGISRTPTAKLLDVVFDITFMSGTTLGQRCPRLFGAGQSFNLYSQPIQSSGSWRTPRLPSLGSLSVLP